MNSSPKFEYKILSKQSHKYSEELGSISSNTLLNNISFEVLSALSIITFHKSEYISNKYESPPSESSISPFSV